MLSNELFPLSYALICKNISAISKWHIMDFYRWNLFAEVYSRITEDDRIEQSFDETRVLRCRRKRKEKKIKIHRSGDVIIEII